MCVFGQELFFCIAVFRFLSYSFRFSFFTCTFTSEQNKTMHGFEESSKKMSFGGKRERERREKESRLKLINLAFTLCSH